MTHLRTPLLARCAWRPPAGPPTLASRQPDGRQPRSQTSPASSGLRANPFPEVTDPFCRLPLSTLFYQLEAANLGDLMRLSVRPATKFTRSLGFSRAVASAPDTTKIAVLSQPRTPSRQANCFQGLRRCEKEKTSLPGACANVSEFVCVTASDRQFPCETHRPNPCAGSGILTGFPFEPRGPFCVRLGLRRCEPPLFHPLAVRLRTDSPMSNCCSHGTFLHFSLQSSHLNICYCHQDPH